VLAIHSTVRRALGRTRAGEVILINSSCSLDWVPEQAGY
jgi:hypothetical protein